MANDIYYIVCDLLRSSNLEPDGHNYALEKWSLDTKYRNRKPVEQVPCERVNMLTTTFGDIDYNVGAYYAKIAGQNKYIVIPQGTGRINRDYNTYYSTKPEYYTDVNKAAMRVVELYITLSKLINETA